MTNEGGVRSHQVAQGRSRPRPGVEAERERAERIARLPRRSRRDRRETCRTATNVDSRSGGPTMTEPPDQPEAERPRIGHTGRARGRD
jgi:hypothetical protein